MSMVEELDLDAARGGDRRAFDRLAAPLRRQILAHCYRMLGSHHDAEEETQETLLRAWRSIGDFEARGSFRSWLYRIATNVCLNAIESGRRRRRLFAPFEYAPADRPPPPGGGDLDTDWLEPLASNVLEDVAEASPDPETVLTARQATRIAFVAALQMLGPRQRAVLLLRDVVGFSAEETAAALEMSVAAANSALQRARASTAERARLRPVIGADVEQALLANYVAAWESGDLDALVGLLKKDARYAMPPFAQWFAGRDAIGAFFGFAWREGGYRGFRALSCAINGQASVAIYARKGEDAHFRAHSVHALEGDDGGIVDIVAFIGPDAVAGLGLPPQL